MRIVSARRGGAGNAGWRMRRDGQTSVRRAVLLGMGAVGGSALAPWSGWVRAQDQPRGGLVEPITPSDVTARAVLYEEDPAEPRGQQFVGAVVWSAAREKSKATSKGNVQADESAAVEMVLRANVVVPDTGLSLKWAMRRNYDRSLPASHVIDMIFDLTADFRHGGIQNVPGVLAKSDERTRGVPLAGLTVKVTTGYFLLGLSAVDTESRRNVMLLKERSWIDIPIVYTDGRRAILAIEKGRAGERAFQETFATWDGAPPDQKSAPPDAKIDPGSPSSPFPPEIIESPRGAPRR